MSVSKCRGFRLMNFQSTRMASNPLPTNRASCWVVASTGTLFSSRACVVKGTRNLTSTELPWMLSCSLSVGRARPITTSITATKKNSLNSLDASGMFSPSLSGKSDEIERKKSLKGCVAAIFPFQTCKSPCQTSASCLSARPRRFRLHCLLPQTEPWTRMAVARSFAGAPLSWWKRIPRPREVGLDPLLAWAAVSNEFDGSLEDPGFPLEFGLLFNGLLGYLGNPLGNGLGVFLEPFFLAPFGVFAAADNCVEVCFKLLFPLPFLVQQPLDVRKRIDDALQFLLVDEAWPGIG